MQNYKDGSGLQFIKFDFMLRQSRNQNCHCNSNSFSNYFVPFDDFFFVFRDNTASLNQACDVSLNSDCNHLT